MKKEYIDINTSQLDDESMTLHKLNENYIDYNGGVVAIEHTYDGLVTFIIEDDRNFFRTNFTVRKRWLDDIIELCKLAKNNKKYKVTNKDGSIVSIGHSINDFDIEMITFILNDTRNYLITNFKVSKNWLDDIIAVCKIAKESDYKIEEVTI